MKKHTDASKKAPKKQKKRIELLHNNPNGYFYRVWLTMTTFGEHPDETNGEFELCTEFKGTNLLYCRKKALIFYNQILQDNSLEYFLPFRSPKYFIRGEHAAHSIWVELVIDESQDEVNIIYGLDDQDDEDGRENEKLIFSEMGIQDIGIHPPFIKYT